jgi:ketosteroid isomerase-like protein
MTSHISDDRLEIVQRFFQQYFDGHFDDAIKLLGPNVEYRVTGKSSLSGTFVGAKAVTNHLRMFLELTETPVDVLQWEDWLVGTTYVACVVRSELQRPGRRDEFRFIFLVQVGVDDKISSVEVFSSNPEAFERFIDS